MPIEKSENRMVFYFGKGDIIFGSAYDKGNSVDNDYVCFYQSQKAYEIDQRLPELEGSQVDDWALKMRFPKIESLQSLITFLVEFRDKKFPPKSEQGDLKNSSGKSPVQQTQPEISQLAKKYCKETESHPESIVGGAIVAFAKYVEKRQAGA